jgi:hypothetical protein
MKNLLQALKQLVQKEPHRAGGGRRPRRRRDPQFVGGSSIKEIEQAPPGRAQELAGHAAERRD